jgi:hypothetical protein
MSAAKRPHEDQLSFTWKTARPAYMREIEPLAHQDAWKSPVPNLAATADPLLTQEQLENRKLFIEGRNRKGPSAVGSEATERKMG